MGWFAGVGAAATEDRRRSQEVGRAGRTPLDCTEGSHDQHAIHEPETPRRGCRHLRLCSDERRDETAQRLRTWRAVIETLAVAGHRFLFGDLLLRKPSMGCEISCTISSGS